MFKNLFISNASFSSISLTIINCFNVFSYNKLNTFIQSFDFVCFDFKFEMYSFRNKIAIDVNKVVLDDITKPILGLMVDKAELVIVEADPIKISVRFSNTLFLFKDLYFFL